MCLPCPICHSYVKPRKDNAARKSFARWAGMLLSIQVVPPAGTCRKCMYAMNQHLRGRRPVLRGEYALLSFMSARLGRLHVIIKRSRRRVSKAWTAACIECGRPAHRTGCRCKGCSAAHKVAITVKFGRSIKGKKGKRERYWKIGPEKRASLCEYGKRKRREAADKRVKYCVDCNKMLGVGNAFMRKTCDECRTVRQRDANARHRERHHDLILARGRAAAKLAWRAKHKHKLICVDCGVCHDKPRRRRCDDCFLSHKKGLYRKASAKYRDSLNVNAAEQGPSP